MLQVGPEKSCLDSLLHLPGFLKAEADGTAGHRAVTQEGDSWPTLPSAVTSDAPANPFAGRRRTAFSTANTSSSTAASGSSARGLLVRLSQGRAGCTLPASEHSQPLVLAGQQCPHSAPGPLYPRAACLKASSTVDDTSSTKDPTDRTGPEQAACGRRCSRLSTVGVKDTCAYLQHTALACDTERHLSVGSLLWKQTLTTQMLLQASDRDRSGARSPYGGGQSDEALQAQRT
ncbi:hypothetical protein MJG53_016081 [Ovis ammon polii x Ovis aries]|uniref:Uncharacterized protein n=1 Tax=Ovis ammon polii x Ovis aries TaxID=2918886 RepID=A0ACB9UAU3_9CETA|nr:hypothetical protein MJG53_016081 [Ovis ammon polii x Ovis aries]